ncbi:MAG TPA: hypothetical protein VF339_11050 [Gammaproteobacteria bacterium]
MITAPPAGVGPAWQSWLGTVAVVLGVLLAAAHGTEWMKQRVIARATPVGAVFPAAECPEDELVEEGLSRAECEQLVSNVRNYVVSAPAWFSGFQSVLAATGTVLAVVSIGIGAALVDRRRWAPGAAVVVFAALAAVDAAGFVAALNTGPILRDVYLWDALVWFFLHFMLAIGAAAGMTAVGAETWTEGR